MKKIKDRSIKQKLLAGFISMVIIVIIVETIGNIGIIRITKMDRSLYEDQTAPITHLINATTSLYHIRVDSRSAVINAGDTDMIDQYESNYLEYKDMFLTESALYRESITDESSLELFDEAADIFSDTYDPVIQETFKLARKGDQTAADNAGAAVTQNVETLFENYSKLVDNRMSHAENTSDANFTTAVVMIIITTIISVVGAVGAIFIGLKIARMISKPIEQVVSAAHKISMGDIDVNLDDVDTRDEVGQLADSFKEMVNSIKVQIDVIENIGNGDFTKKVAIRSENDALGIAIKKIQSNLSHVMFTINSAAEQVNTSASQISGASQALATGATEQASTVEELSASISTVAQQADQTAENVKEASRYVEQATSGMVEGNKQMSVLTNAMKDIREASDKISSITKVIEDIAFQTNILALNAAIEAARAGVAGKGFAVVADEVRNLAAKSAQAAKQTSELIQRSSATVTDGDKAAVKTAQLLKDVAEKSEHVNNTIQQISDATSEQANAIGQITQGLSQVSTVVQTNAASAEESSATSEELAAQAQTLHNEVAKIKFSDNNDEIAGTNKKYMDFDYKTYAAETKDGFGKY